MNKNSQYENKNDLNLSKNVKSNNVDLKKYFFQKNHLIYIVI